MQRHPARPAPVQTERSQTTAPRSQPVLLDPKLFQSVAGGLPKGTWSSTESALLPKGTW